MRPMTTILILSVATWMSACVMPSTGGGEVTAIPSCTDGLSNGAESDVDCGGECGPCATGLQCEAAGDCASGVCDDSVCTEVSCDDGFTNGSEADVDCGGSCSPCAEGLACTTGDDCASGVCAEAACNAPACDDGLTNGVETALDCGGPCAPCADGLACVQDTDCASGICTDQQCATNPRAVYPEGPFGNRVDGVMENVSLVRSDDSEVSMATLRLDPSRKVLLIFNTAAWCSRCAADMPDLIELHEDLGERGLTVMVSLFQDNGQDRPNGRDAALYQREHDLPFLVVADPTQLMLEYFERVGLPMVLVVDLESMDIVHAELGWSLPAMRRLVETHL